MFTSLFLPSTLLHPPPVSVSLVLGSHRYQCVSAALLFLRFQTVKLREWCSVSTAPRGGVRNNVTLGREANLPVVSFTTVNEGLFSQSDVCRIIQCNLLMPNMFWFCWTKTNSSLWHQNLRLFFFYFLSFFFFAFGSIFAFGQLHTQGIKHYNENEFQWRVLQDNGTFF